MGVLELFSEQWLMRTALAGGVVLLLGVLWMLATKQPARRQWLGETALLCSLLVAGLCALPAWLPVAVPLCGAELPTGIGAAEPVGQQTTHTSLEPVVPRADDDMAYVFLVEEASLPAAKSDSAPLSALSAPPAPPIAKRGAALPWRARLESAYLALGALFLGYLVIGYLGLIRLLRNSRPAPARVQDLLGELTRQWRRQPQLRVCDKLTAPVSFGLRRPTILIPPAFCRLHCEDQLRWVLVHELTHLERRDAWGCLLLAVGQAVYFYLPWFWWLRRQVRLAQEYVADAAAAAISSSEDYAQYLVSLSLHVSDQRSGISTRRLARLSADHCPLTAGVLGSSSELFRRVTMLLNSPRQVEKRCPRWLSWAASASLLAVAVFVSGVSVRAEEPKAKKDGAQLPAEIILELAPVITAKPKADVELILRSVKVDGVPDTVILQGVPQGVIVRGIEEKPGSVVLTGDHVARIQGLIQDASPDPKARRIKELDEALKRLEEAAKQANTQLPEDAKKQLEELHKQLEKVRKQTDEELAKVRTQVKQQVEEAVKQRVRASEALAKVAQARQDGWVHRFVLQPRTRLGAQIQTPGETLASQLDLPKGQGLVVAEVVADSPAAKAGIQNHDILLEFNGKTVSSDPAEFVKAVQSVKGDAAVDAVVLRKGKKVTIKGISMPEASKDASGGDQVLQWRDGDFKAFKNLKDLNEWKSVQVHPGSVDFVFPRGPNSVSTTIIRNNDKFTSRHHEGSLSISISGTIADNKAKLGEITIKDGDSDSKFDSLDKVPEKYRDKVKSLLEMAEKGHVKAEAKDKDKSKQ